MLTLRCAIALVCLAACAAPPPRVVTVIVPYTAVIPFDFGGPIWGRTACDLNNQPYVFVSVHLDANVAPWVRVHELIHVSQIRSHAKGCHDYIVQYDSDPNFRLRVETEAFCGVHDAQKAAKIAPEPSIESITRVLSRGYGGQWSDDEIRGAMQCWKRRAPSDTLAKHE